MTLKSNISVIIPMYNAAETIEECLMSLTKQTMQDFEVIVVNDGSTDDSEKKVRTFPFKLINLVNGGSSSKARNFGAKHAQANLLVFVDADIVLESDSLTRIVNRLDEPGTDIVSANYTDVMPLSGFISQLQNLFLAFRFSHLPDYICFVFSSFCTIRKEAFEAVNGFNEQMSAYEDIELGYQLLEKGYRSRLDPSIEVIHLKKYDHLSLLTDYIKKAYAAGSFYRKIFTSKVQKGGKMPNSLKWASLSSLLILGSLCLLPWTNKPLFLAILMYSLFMIPFLRYLLKRQSVFFGVKSYFVIFEVFIISYMALLCGIIRGD